MGTLQIQCREHESLLHDLTKLEKIFDIIVCNASCGGCLNSCRYYVAKDTSIFQ